jgi:hypothetical protein
LLQVLYHPDLDMVLPPLLSDIRDRARSALPTYPK